MLSPLSLKLLLVVSSCMLLGCLWLSNSRGDTATHFKSSGLIFRAGTCLCLSRLVIRFTPVCKLARHNFTVSRFLLSRGLKASPIALRLHNVCTTLNTWLTLGSFECLLLQSLASVMIQLSQPSPAQLSPALASSALSGSQFSAVSVWVFGCLGDWGGGRCVAGVFATLSLGMRQCTSTQPTVARRF